MSSRLVVIVASVLWLCSCTTKDDDSKRSNDMTSARLGDANQEAIPDSFDEFILALSAPGESISGDSTELNELLRDETTIIQFSNGDTAHSVDQGIFSVVSVTFMSDEEAERRDVLVGNVTTVFLLLAAEDAEKIEAGAYYKIDLERAAKIVSQEAALTGNRRKATLVLKPRLIGEQATCPTGDCLAPEYFDDPYGNEKLYCGPRTLCVDPSAAPGKGCSASTTGTGFQVASLPGASSRGWSTDLWCPPEEPYYCPAVIGTPCRQLPPRALPLPTPPSCHSDSTALTSVVSDRDSCPPAKIPGPGEIILHDDDLTGNEANVNPSDEVATDSSGVIQLDLQQKVDDYNTKVAEVAEGWEDSRQDVSDKIDQDAAEQFWTVGDLIQQNVDDTEQTQSLFDNAEPPPGMTYETWEDIIKEIVLEQNRISQNLARLQGNLRPMYSQISQEYDALVFNVMRQVREATKGVFLKPDGSVVGDFVYTDETLKPQLQEFHIIIDLIEKKKAALQKELERLLDYERMYSPGAQHVRQMLDVVNGK